MKGAARVLSIAGKSIRRDLKRIHGTPEKAEKAIREKAQDESTLEQWATIQLGELFRFHSVPAPLRQEAAFSMAAAMLVWESGEYHEDNSTEMEAVLG
jgi:hypothetical protein